MDEKFQEKALKAFQAARQKFHFSNVEFNRAIQATNLTVLVCKGRIGSLIGKGGTVVKELAKELNGKVRIVEKTNNEKKLVSDITGNARILGLDEIFSAKGIKSLRVVVSAMDRHKLIATVEELEKIIFELSGHGAQIVFR